MTKRPPTKRHILRGDSRDLWCGKHHVFRKGTSSTKPTWVRPVSITEDEFDSNVVDPSGVCVNCRRSLAVARSRGQA